MTRSTLRVSRQTWHGRLWHWWRDHSEFKNGKLDSYRENLCHYVRVVVFWGPLALFLRYPLGRWWLTPFTLLAGIAGLTGITTALILSPGDVLAVVGILLAVALFTTMAGLSCAYIDEHKEDIRQWWRTDGYGTHPIKAVGRFLSRPILKVPVAVWLVIATILLLTALVDVAIGLFVLGVIGWIIALIAIASGVGFLSEKAKARKAAKAGEPEPEEGAVRVAGRYLVAKKHKVCPFIEVIG